MASKPRKSLASRAAATAGKVVKKTVAKATTAAAPAKQAPAKKAPAKKVTVSGTPAKSSTKTPAKKPARKTSVQKTAEKAPAEKAPAKKSPAKKSPAKKSPAKKAVAKKAVATKAAATKTPVKKTTVTEAPDRTDAPQQTTQKTTQKTARKAPQKATSGGTSADHGELVVLAAEDPWTKAELKQVRVQLDEDVTRLTAELTEVEGDLAGMIENSGEGAGHDQADVGSASFERDQEMVILNNARDMLEQSEHALERIADGTYGQCENCGNAIGKNRLMAFPRATLCLVCKQREERR